MSVIRAPEIDHPAAVWLNTDRPLRLRELRGRIVVLDFWTLGCVNCIHVIPALRRIERTFPTEVAVVGIHSPKFAAEREVERVQSAIARFGIEHPVLHDPQMRLWEAYAVRGWPTLVVVDPTGRISRVVVGEPDPDEFLEYITDSVAGWTRMEMLKTGPPTGSAGGRTGSTLSFPARIRPLSGGFEFVVADSGHHQIVRLDESGRELGRFGSGRRGFDDGGEGAAMFDSPQGLVADQDSLYVADTGNHAIRAIDLTTGEVSTLAGNGERGEVLPFAPGSRLALASPWDLELHGEVLYFANAGSHQLGALDLKTGKIAAVAGNGEENLVDGPARQALLAQPSGLALDAESGRLYFVDAESSAVRVLVMDGEPRVETLVGKGLFTWGEGDGPFSEALLQHPTGIAYGGDRLYVADSYNNTVRTLDLTGGSVGDLLRGFICLDDVCLPLAEPAGLTVDEPRKRLLVADTNNHRLLEVSLTDRSYRTWAGAAAPGN